MTINLLNVKQEWAFFLRNSDIFTVSQRGVTTTTDSGTFASDSTHLINVSNGRNVRSVVVASVTLTYGTDYTVDVNFDDSGTIKIKLTFTSAQTGDYTITYDFGTDKIFPDFPKKVLNINNFPRIGSGIINVPTEPAGFGGVNVSKIGITTIVYDANSNSVNGYIDAIRAAIFAARTDFFYLGNYVQIISTGPILKSPEELGRNKVLQQNIDVEGILNYEK